MRWAKRVTVSILVAMPLQAAADVQVFTTSYLPVGGTQSSNVVVHLLDAPQKPLAELSEGLPDTYEAATPVALSRINSEKGRRLLGQLKRAYQGVVIAYQNDIAALPAVLVDRQYVVYGVYDLNEALRRVADYRSGRQR